MREEYRMDWNSIRRMTKQICSGEKVEVNTIIEGRPSWYNFLVEITVLIC